LEKFLKKIFLGEIPEENIPWRNSWRKYSLEKFLKKIFLEEILVKKIPWRNSCNWNSQKLAPQKAQFKNHVTISFSKKIITNSMKMDKTK
jgi:hypothetical protein